MCVLSRLAKLPVSRGNKLKVLFDTDPSEVDKLCESVLIFDSVFFPILCSAVAWMKALDVDPTVEEKDFPFPQTAFVKQLSRGSRWNNHFVDGVIERHHVLPCQSFQTDVPRVVLDIFRNVCVICRRGFNLKCLSSQ